MSRSRFIGESFGSQTIPPFVVRGGRHSTREGAFGQPGGNDAVVNVVDVVVLAPGLGGKQMLYTQRAFFLEIVGPNWDNIYRIGDVQHDFDWIWVCFNVVPCVSGTGSHDNLQNFSSHQWVFSGGGVFDDSHHGRVLRACWCDVFSKTSSIPWQHRCLCYNWRFSTHSDGWQACNKWNSPTQTCI